MIQINKGPAPQKLLEIEKKLIKSLKIKYTKHEADYNSGNKKFIFSKDYNINEVKEALIDCQKDKCCFCEAKFCRDYPNVEHFRPKGRVDPYPKGKSAYPGYYWMAYSWSNLFLCKSAINSSDKRNYFPLEKGSPRNRSPRDNYVERPLLIDPHQEDPRQFIRFHNDEPYPVNGNYRGRFNIDFFRLRHPQLVEARQTKFKLLVTLKKAVEIGISAGIAKETFIEQIETLREAMDPAEEFSSMAIDLLKDWPHFA